MVCTRTSGKRSTRSTKIPLWRLPLKNRLPRRKNESSGQAEGKSPVHITETLTTTGETNVQDDTYKKDFDDYMTGFLSLLFTCMDDGRVPIAVKELVSERLNKISEDKADHLSYYKYANSNVEKGEYYLCIFDSENRIPGINNDGNYDINNVGYNIAVHT